MGYSIALLFDSSTLSFRFGEGSIPIVSFILSAFPCAYIVSWIIKRAKKCLDHVSTIYIIHLVMSWLIVQFPSNWDWWVVNFCSFIIMAVLSEYLCIRSEMQVIKLVHNIVMDGDTDTDTDSEDDAEKKSLLTHPKADSNEYTDDNV